MGDDEPITKFGRASGTPNTSGFDASGRAVWGSAESVDALGEAYQAELNDSWWQLVLWNHLSLSR